MRRIEYIKATPLLIDVLRTWDVRIYDYKHEGTLQYLCSFNADGFAEVKAAVNNSKARFFKFGNRYRFYSLEVWSELMGENRKRTSYGHVFELSHSPKKERTHCCSVPLKMHTFKDGNTIKLCRVCSLHFTTIFEQPLIQIDAQRRAVLCGVGR